MLRDFVLELVAAPAAGATITLPGVAPTGRVTWASAFLTSRPFVFYVLDNSLMQEWGVGQLVIGSPSTIIRPTVVLGNSAGTTARLNFTSTCRCFSSLPSLAILEGINNPIGRNLLHNGRFDVNQRGAGPWTTPGGPLYGSDRWYHLSNHSTGSFSDTVQAFNDSNRAIVGDEQAEFALNSVVVGGTGANEFDLIGQRIENVRLLGGKTVTFSFWALTTVAGAKVAVQAVQNFGSGGSPSTPLGVSVGAITLTTGFVRYAVTFALPSVAGKTLGTNADDNTEIRLWMSAGSTNSASQASSIGVQSASFTFWGLQLEIGVAPSDLERRDYEIELGLCQRFYQIAGGTASACSNAAGATYFNVVGLAPTMRTTPTLVFVASGGGNYTSVTAVGSGAKEVVMTTTVTAIGTAAWNFSFTASADL